MSTANVVRYGFVQHWKPSVKSHWKQSISHQRDQPLIYSQQRLLCLLVLVRFCLLNPPSTRTSQKKRKKKEGVGDEKAKALTDHWSVTQLLKSLTSNQIVQLQGAEVPQSCPRPLHVTNQLWGVNAHFSQLSRTCDGGKGKHRSNRGHHTHKYQESYSQI